MITRTLCVVHANYSHVSANRSGGPALYEALVQSSPDAVVVVAADGFIVFVNDRCADLLGYERGELLGQKVEKLLPDRHAEHAELREKYLRRPAMRPMGNRPVLSARHRSGHPVPVMIALSPLRVGDEVLTQAVLRDAMPRWQVQQDLLVQSVAMDAAANGIVITDVEGVIEWVNPAVTRMTGYAAGELVGQHTRILKSGVHDAAFYRELWETVAAGKTWFGSMVNRRKDGSSYHEEQHIAPVLADDGKITHYIAIKQDVTDREMAVRDLEQAHQELKRQLKEIETLHEQLREQAIRDPLTDLFNRRYLVETLRRELARARREKTPLCVVAIDVDHFKQLNDTLGHKAGDDALVLLAEQLTDSIRESDVACRLGGDELLVLLPGAPLAVAEQRAAMWREQFVEQQETLWAGLDGVRCTLSIGVTALRDGESAQVLLERADQLLYDAKRGGRDRVACE